MVQGYYFERRVDAIRSIGKFNQTRKRHKNKKTR